MSYYDLNLLKKNYTFKEINSFSKAFFIIISELFYHLTLYPQKISKLVLIHYKRGVFIKEKSLNESSAVLMYFWISHWYEHHTLTLSLRDKCLISRHLKLIPPKSLHIFLFRVHQLLPLFFLSSSWPLPGPNCS